MLNFVQDYILESSEHLINSSERENETIKACLSPSNMLPPRTINEEDEDEIIKQLEAYQRQRLEENPMRELDEALMDRTTASQNRKHKIINV